MKRILLVAILATISLSAFSQNVIKFLGIPVDGTKREMITKLVAKGYELDSESDALFGEFNGIDAVIAIQTVNNRVWRIGISDLNTINEANIKIRFNNLFDQLSNNAKYELVDGCKLKDSDDISYEMHIHNKRFDAIFAPKDKTIHGAVWYTITESYGKYRIAMFYENLDNAANGDDL